MPSKRNTITVEADEEITIEAVQPEPEEERKPFGEQVGDFVASIGSCGHVNKQSHNKDNELEDLACTLDKGHAGDHSAELDGKQTFWSDAAGKPTGKVK